MISGQLPSFEIGNGTCELQAATLWITVAGKPWAGGTSITPDGGVDAVSVNIRLGLLGSSLAIVRVHDLAPPEVGVNAIVRGRLESWLMPRPPVESRGPDSSEVWVALPTQSARIACDVDPAAGVPAHGICLAWPH
jgi:hypothetical protein